MEERESNKHQSFKDLMKDIKIGKGRKKTRISHKEIINLCRDAELYKGTQIFRWASRNTIKSENDCEHQNIVSQITIIICEIYDVDIKTYRDAVCLASIHDMFEYAEGGMGDVPHSVKLKSPEIAKLVEQHEENTILGIPFFGEIWDEARSNPLAWDIVMLADALDVILYIDREKDLGSMNQDFDIIFEKTVDRIIKSLQDIEGDL